MPRKGPIALTRLEAEVMGAVWDAAGPVRVREIADALNKGRKEPLAYTTVQTMLTILRDKKIVETVAGEGRAHLFRAKVSRDDASGHMLRDLAQRLFGGRVEPMLSRLIDEGDLTADELQRLRSFIDDKLRDEKGASK